MAAFDVVIVAIGALYRALSATITTSACTAAWFFRSVVCSHKINDLYGSVSSPLILFYSLSANLLENYEAV